MSISESDKQAAAAGRGVIKNGRYYNTGQTRNADGTLRYDFDAANKSDPGFNGLVFSHYEDDQPVFRDPQRS